jgi:hypothetical protein
VGDAVFSTNNAVLLRRYRNLKPIACEQHKAQKKKITESAIIKSNLNGFGNKVGSITNRATSMLSVQAQFPKDSKEYQTLAYRIVCTQFQQQNEIDKIKGIISKPMPKYWYSYKDCQNDFQRSICCEKKPYFMIYRYKNEKKIYKKFIDDYSQYCQINFNMDIEELIHMPQEQMTDAQKEFVYWFNKLLPVDNNPCTINRICWYIEKELNDYTIDLKSRQYDWKQKLISNVRCTTIQFDSMVNIISDFANQISYDNDGEINADTYNTLIDDYVKLAVQYCDNYKQRINICLRIAYDKNIKKQCAIYKDLIWAIIVDAYKNER